MIECQITPNDGLVDGISVGDEVTINNTDPVMDTIMISPESDIEANTPMTCEATASDLDNEALTITYAWTKADGTVLGSEAELQLDTTIVSPDDEVVCTATVTDPHGAVATWSSLELFSTRNQWLIQPQKLQAMLRQHLA